MHPRITPIFIGLFLANFLCHSQTLEWISKDNSFYKKFEHKGAYANGNRVGKWIDISYNKIIYREYYYDKSGVPCNTWKLFYPDGKLRKETQFENNHIIKLTRYSSDSTRQFEVSSPEGIHDSILNKVNDLEERFFIAEGRVFEEIDYRISGHMQNKVSKWVLDYYLVMSSLVKDVSDPLFTGSLDIWYEEGKHWKKYNFIQGRETCIMDYWNKAGNLKEQDEYDSGKLIKKTFYNTDGTIKRIKSR